MGNIAPDPRFEERAENVFERKGAPSVPGQTGPNRFFEGIGTDTDVPNEFANGALQGYTSAPGRPNRNQNVFEKWPEETMKERAHVGSAAWVEATSFLSNFAGGAFVDYDEPEFQETINDGSRKMRVNPATVTD